MDQRSDRMKTLLINTFFSCLEKEDFSTVTVGKLAEKAQINRSTFYRHFEDKYRLRDHVVDSVIADFVDNLEVDFLNLDIQKSKQYSKTLQHSLEHIYEKKRELEILWNQKLLGRNVFEEMIDGGVGKIVDSILQNPSITDEKKQYAEWYARLLLNNMLVSIRWWFLNSDKVNAAKMTEMMKQHMVMGTIPTLKSK